MRLHYFCHSRYNQVESRCFLVNEDELHHIREYIVYNPLKWEFDLENPNNLR